MVDGTITGIIIGEVTGSRCTLEAPRPAAGFFAVPPAEPAHLAIRKTRCWIWRNKSWLWSQVLQSALRYLEVQRTLTMMSTIIMKEVD